MTGRSSISFPRWPTATGGVTPNCSKSGRSAGSRELCQEGLPCESWRPARSVCAGPATNGALRRTRRRRPRRWDWRSSTSPFPQLSRLPCASPSSGRREHNGKDATIRLHLLALPRTQELDHIEPAAQVKLLEDKVHVILDGLLGPVLVPPTVATDRLGNLPIPPC